MIEYAVGYSRGASIIGNILSCDCKMWVTRCVRVIGHVFLPNPKSENQSLRQGGQAKQYQMIKIPT